MNSVVECSKCEALALRWCNLIKVGWLNTNNGWLCPAHTPIKPEVKEPK